MQFSISLTIILPLLLPLALAFPTISVNTYADKTCQVLDVEGYAFKANKACTQFIEQEGSFIATSKKPVKAGCVLQVFASTDCTDVLAAIDVGAGCEAPYEGPASSGELAATVSWMKTDLGFVKNKIKIKKLLGYGVQGMDWLVMNEATRRNHVVKLNKNSRNVAEKVFFVDWLEREHPRILSLQAFVGFDTYDARRDESIQLPLYSNNHVFVQLTEALAFLHGVLEEPDNLPTGDDDPKTIQPKNGFFHNEIKPSIIMLMWKPNDFERKQYPDIKLGDFGLWFPFEVSEGKAIEDVELPSYQVAIPYLAPEMSLGDRNIFTVKTEGGHDSRFETLGNAASGTSSGGIEKTRSSPRRPQKRRRLDSDDEEDRKLEIKAKEVEKKVKAKPKKPVDRFLHEDMDSRYTRRMVTDLPFQYTEILDETMNTALTLDPKDRPTSAKLFIDLWKLAKACKDILFRSFPV
ncbi:hypothetical protein MMC11_005178 [Xylographa trunciseda]|nr:hypothetical protein [Xylographa trunciseda]